MSTVNGTVHKYKYNGQEQLKDLGMNVTEMTWRQYDNALGRFHGIDALAAMSPGLTPYHFANNNPIVFSDPTGLRPESMVESLGEFGFIQDGQSWNPYATKAVHWAGENGLYGSSVSIAWEKHLNEDNGNGLDSEQMTIFNNTFGGGEHIGRIGRNGRADAVMVPNNTGGNYYAFLAIAQDGNMGNNDGTGVPLANGNTLVMGHNGVDTVGSGNDSVGFPTKTVLGATGLGLVGLGYNGLSTAAKTSGATKGTSVISRYLSSTEWGMKKTPKYIFKYTPKRILGMPLRSPVVGRLLGRAVPIAGWALLVTDIVLWFNSAIVDLRTKSITSEVHTQFDPSIQKAIKYGEREQP